MPRPQRTEREREGDGVPILHTDMENIYFFLHNQGFSQKSYYRQKRVKCYNIIICNKTAKSSANKLLTGHVRAIVNAVRDSGDQCNVPTILD